MQIQFPDSSDLIKIKELKSGQNQKRLAIVGAGALANWFLYALQYDDLAFDFSEIMIIDDDHVDETNLNRQIFFTKEDIGKFKADVIASKLENSMFGVQVEAITKRVTDESFFYNNPCSIRVNPLLFYNIASYSQETLRRLSGRTQLH